jgi:hypothetical protein
MFTTIEIAINIDDELAALLADHASYMSDDSGLTPTSPLADPGDQTAPPVIDTGAITPTDLPADPTTATDATTVVDPMASSDAVVFTGTTAPVVEASASMMDPSADPAIAGETPLADVVVDVSNLPALEGLVDLGDGSFSFDLTVLDVGRSFGGSGFMDLP